MTKFSWEPLDRGSLLLRITDGDKETIWKVRRNTSRDKLIKIFWEMRDNLMEQNEREAVRMEPSGAAYGDHMEYVLHEEGKPSEIAQKAAQAASGARWMDAYEDDTYTVEIPDYDSGEIK